MKQNDRNYESVGADQTRTILFVTTNDIRNPVRGCDRRSAQIIRHLDGGSGNCRLYFSKEIAGERQQSNGELVVPYPRFQFLAPFHPVFIFHLLKLSLNRDFDWVVVSGLGSVVYGIISKLLFGAHLVVDQHNAEYILAKELKELHRYVMAVTFGRIALSLADVLVFTAESDLRHYSEKTMEKSIIVSNGFDSETFFPNDVEDSTRSGVLFFGNLNYEPNREALEYIADELVPRISRRGCQRKMKVAGPGSSHYVGNLDSPDSLEILGLVENIAECIRRSELVVVPLRNGSGTRLKIIESLACGTPVISTPKGAEGWPEEWENLVIVDLPRFADVTLSELESGPQFVRDELAEYAQYSWNRQVKKIEERMDEVSHSN